MAPPLYYKTARLSAAEFLDHPSTSLQQQARIIRGYQFETLSKTFSNPLLKLKEIHKTLEHLIHTPSPNNAGV
jgi:hypothetical protein